MDALETARDVVWTWVAAPVLAIAAIIVTVVLRAPQITKLGEGVRAAFANDPKAPGTMPPGTALLLSTAATWGSAAAISAATAVALGGAGAIAWLWLFGFLLAPLRYAETLLARSAAPGKAGSDARGSLGARLAGDSSGPVGELGKALLILVPVCAFAWVGGVHGEAVSESASRLLPGSEIALGIAVAVASALFVMLLAGVPGGAKAATAGAPAIVGWIALAAIAGLFGVSVIAFMHDVGRGFGAFPRALEDATQGAQNAGAFSGALAGEIAGAALRYLLPPIAATTGTDGAIEDAGRAPTARAQAAVSLLAPLVHVVLATLLGFSFIATGAFSRRVDDERSLVGLTFWRSGFDTVSQRLEVGDAHDEEAADRTFTGTVRVIDGEARARPLEVGTSRGMIVSPHFVQDGAPGDFALRITRGRVETMLVPDEHHTLVDVPLTQLATVRVEGRMLPTGGLLVASSMARGGGDIASRIALTALLLLASIGAAAWGVAASRVLPARVSLAGAFLPAAGLVLAATGAAPWLATVGGIVAGVMATLAAVGIAIKARELAKLGPTGKKPKK